MLTDSIEAIRGCLSVPKRRGGGGGGGGIEMNMEIALKTDNYYEVSPFQASKVEFHKSETFQFGNVNPIKDPAIANTYACNSPPKEAFNSLVLENGHELGKQKETIPAVEEQKSSSMTRSAKTSLVFR